MAPPTYVDFDLLIERVGERFRVRVLDSPAGQSSAEFGLPFDERDLEMFVLRVLGTGRRVRDVIAPEMANIKEFGAHLYDAVFGGEVGTCLARSHDLAAAQGAGLRIRLRTEESANPTGVSLLDVPWEFLYDRMSGSFLGLSEDSPLVRYPNLPQSVQPLAVEPPLNVLVVVASPAGFPQLDVEREVEKLQSATASLQKAGRLTIHRLETPTLEALQATLRRGRSYHVFHFVGHGGFDRRSQDGQILLQDESGKGRPVSGEILKVLLGGYDSLRLAVLNACEGARTSASDPFAGVAQTLLQGGVPAVIAMQMPISDEAAIVLSEEFYSALADGYPVDAALAEARKAIFARVSAVEWAIPVLYLRAVDGQIFELSGAPPVPDAGARGAVEPAPPESPPEPAGPAAPTPVPTGPRARWTPARLAAFGGPAVAVLALVVFLVVRAIGGGSENPPVSPTTDPTTPPPGFPQIVWTAMDDPDLAVPGTKINRVAAGSDLVVAVGSASSDAAVWTSPNGTDWTRVTPVLDVFGGGGTQEMNMVIALNVGFVAVGVSGPDAAVWTSPDGLAWERVADPGVFGGEGTQVMNRVVARSSSQLIGVGFERVQGSDAAVVWRSSDGGATWERLPPATVFESGPGAHMRGVAVAPNGRIVAGGFDGRGLDTPVGAAVWTSADGETWERRPAVADGAPFGGAGEQQIATVASHGTGFVAVGEDGASGSLDAAVWTSADGLGWERRAGSADLGGAGRQTMIYVVSTSSGLVGVGADNATGSDNGAAWLSSDGVSWSRSTGASLGGANAQAMRGAACFQNMIIAVGLDTGHAAIWLGTGATC